MTYVFRMNFSVQNFDGYRFILYEFCSLFLLLRDETIINEFDVSILNALINQDYDEY